MSREQNIATTKLLGEAVSSGNLDQLDQIFAQNVVDHDPAPDQGPGPDGYKAFFKKLRSAFPDLKITADDLIATDDQVALAYTINGTQNGPFLGLPPTGKPVKVRGMQIARFNGDGKIVERWGSSDELGILRQIGAVKV